MSRFRASALSSCVLSALIFSTFGFGQNVPALVTRPIDNSVRTVLKGNVHPLARATFDRGEVSPSMPLHRMLLVLKRSDQQETALRSLIENQQYKKSSSYHQWLTPQQFGAQFGPSDADVAAVVNWLTSSGFEVTSVSNGRTVIEFNGTAGQVKQSFGTALHRYVVNGEEHLANASDPSIPTALAPVLAGVNSLHNFLKKAQNVYVGKYSAKTRQLTPARPNLTYPDANVCGGNCYALGPYDFANIYDLIPLWSATPTPVNGSGVTIAIVGRTDINPDDAPAFWSLFGLDGTNAPQPTLNIITNGPDPGFNGDEPEADIDTQWSGAVAPGATIDYVNSLTTETEDGIDLSALYIVDNNVAPIMSESYGACELAMGLGGVDFYSAIWEQAAAQGITVMVSTGDNGAAGCDDPNGPVTEEESGGYYDGLAVNGIASTWFNVAVGGTDFNQYDNWTTYWNSSNAATTQQSVKNNTYIPEIAWNDSCTNPLWVTLGWGANAEAVCNNSDLGDIYPSGGSGGESAYWPTPTWQTGIPNPSDNARDMPDVSLFASNGFVSSFYLICQSDASASGSCDVTSPDTDLQGYGGTSVASPAFAGIMALVNQKTGSLQGNANLNLYNLLSKQPNAFHDVAVGSTIAMPCYTGSTGCLTNIGSDPIGITATSSSVVAWPTRTGYDLATGLGSVDAANLVNNWNKATFTPSTTTLTLNSGNPVNVTHGSAVAVTVTVAPQSGTGTPTGDVSLLVNPKPGQSGIDGFTLSGGTVSGENTILLPGGTYKVIAHYGGDTTFGGSYSSPSSNVTVTAENSSVFMPGLVTGVDSNDNPTYSTSVVYGTGFFYDYLLRADVLNNAGDSCRTSAIACPTGTITFKDNGTALDGGSFALNSAGYTEDQNVQLTGGNHTLNASYSGDSSYKTSSLSTAVAVTPAPTSVSVSAPTSANVNQSFTVTATVSSSDGSYGVAPTGTVTFFANGTTLGTASTTPTNGDPYTGTTASLGASLTTSIATAGTYSITASFTTGDGNYSSQSSSNAPQITITGPTFTIPSIPAVTISAPGGTGTATVTLTPVSGFTGTVTITCTPPGSMTETSCPQVMTTIGASAVNATVTITTTAPHQVSARATGAGLFGLGVVAGVFLFAIPGFRKNKTSLTLLVFAFIVLLASCGGGGGGGSTTRTDPGTPAGTYTVNLSATSGSVTVPATFRVTVQ
jgi:subtilase family serine protease